VFIFCHIDRFSEKKKKRINKPFEGITVEVIWAVCFLACAVTHGFSRHIVLFYHLFSYLIIFCLKTKMLMALVMCRVSLMLKYCTLVLRVDCHLQSRVCFVLRAVCCLLVFAVFSLKPGARPERLHTGRRYLCTDPSLHCRCCCWAALRGNKRRWVHTLRFPTWSFPILT